VMLTVNDQFCNVTEFSTSTVKLLVEIFTSSPAYSLVPGAVFSLAA